MAELSATQKDALIAISKSSGLAIAEGGGTWAGPDGRQLNVTPRHNSLNFRLGTSTIYALEKRGLLKRLYIENLPHHRDTRAITDKGVALVAELTELTEREQDNG